MLETLCKVPFVVIRKFFHESMNEMITGDLNSRECWKMRKSPDWLGGFDFQMNKGNYKFKNSIYPSQVGVWKVIECLETLVTEQVFNTSFIQKYEVGQEVKSHRDPMNNTGCTIISHWGEWTGAHMKIAGETLITNPGDVVILRCNMNNLERPEHSVSKILTGIKYSIILNTIK